MKVRKNWQIAFPRPYRWWQRRFAWAAPTVDDGPEHPTWFQHQIVSKGNWLLCRITFSHYWIPGPGPDEGYCCNCSAFRVLEGEAE